MIVAMEFFQHLVLWGGLIALWSWIWRQYYAPKTYHDEVHIVTTEDNWKLSLLRYRPQDPDSPKAFPVVLCHGLGASSHLFEAEEKTSIARYFTKKGYEVWSINLRAHGLSEKPNIFGSKHYGWTVDDYLRYDLKASLDHICKISGVPKVHYIGHSMGGILLYCLAATFPHAPIASATTIGSSLNYSNTPSDFHFLKRFSLLTSILPAVPAGFMATFVSPLTGRMSNRIEQFLAWPENIRPRTLRVLHASSFFAISSGVLEQLQTGMEEGGLKSSTDHRHYLDDFKKTEMPIYAIGGDRDYQCHADAIRQTMDQLQNPENTQIEIMGPANGQKNHYGHCDLVVGKEVESEVYPKILSWIERHDQA